MNQSSNLFAVIQNHEREFARLLRRVPKATVNFRPKSNPEQGMQMNYTLERKGKKWVVLKKAGSTSSPHGEATVAPAPAPTGDLPPGHPPVSPSATPAEPPK